MSIRSYPPPRLAGFTLSEFMVALGVGTIVTVALVGIMMYTAFAFAGIMNYTELEAQSRNTLDQMTDEIRHVTRLTAYNSNRLAFENGGTNTLTYEYDPSERTLVRTRNGTPTTLLSECDALRFDIFQRNLTNGTWDPYPTSLSDSNTKVVQLKWTCSRTLKGVRLNTETVQSTKIVIRNQL